MRKLALFVLIFVSAIGTATYASFRGGSGGGGGSGASLAGTNTWTAVNTFNEQVVDPNGYKISTFTVTESGGNVTMLTTNDANGPSYIMKSGVSLNSGASHLRLLKSNNVIDFNFKTGGQLETGGTILSGGSFGVNGGGTLTISGTPADGSSAIGTKLNTSGVTFSTAGAEIAEFQNNTTAKSAVNLNGGYIFKVSPTLATCASTNEGTLERQKGGTSGVRTELCLCTSDGAGSPAYAWKNISGIYALDSSSVGTTTTCPDSP